MTQHLPATVRHEATSSTVACTLTTKGAAQQIRSWEQVVEQAIDSTPLVDGIRMTFPAGLTEDLQRLAASEASCWSLLTIEVATSANTASITITSEAEGGQAIIARIAGLPPFETVSP